MKQLFSNLITITSFSVIGLCCGPGFAQVYYGAQPWYYGGAYPYGYGYGGVGSTVYSTNAQAYSNLLRTQAQYNEAAAEAMLRYQQARGMYIQNQAALLDLYQQRAQQIRPIRPESLGDRAADRERGQRDREADQQRGSEGLTSAEYNPSTGKLHFPAALKDPAFEEERSRLQSLFAMRAAFGAAQERDQQIVETSQRMLSMLKERIEELPPAEYLAARTFLEHARNTAMSS